MMVWYVMFLYVAYACFVDIVCLYGQLIMSISNCITLSMRDSLGAECAKCNEQCVTDFDVCTGFPDLDEEVVAVDEEDEVVVDVVDDISIEEDTMPISKIDMMSLPTTESLSDDEPTRVRRSCLYIFPLFSLLSNSSYINT